MPYHRSYEEDVSDLIPGEPVELAFDLHPTSNIFNSGHRIRVAITCADKDNALTPELSPPPTVTLYRSKNQASHVVLPVVGAEEAAADEGLPILMIAFIVALVVILVLVFSVVLGKRVSKK